MCFVKSKAVFRVEENGFPGQGSLIRTSQLPEKEQKWIPPWGIDSAASNLYHRLVGLVFFPLQKDGTDFWGYIQRIHPLCFWQGFMTHSVKIKLLLKGGVTNSSAGWRSWAWAGSLSEEGLKLKRPAVWQPLCLPGIHMAVLGKRR